MEEMFHRGGCQTPDQAPPLVKPSPFGLPCLFKLCGVVTTVPDRQRGAGRAGGLAQASSTTWGGTDRPQQQKTPLTNSVIPSKIHSKIAFCCSTKNEAVHDKASLIIAFRAAEVFNSLTLLTSAHKDFAHTLEVSCGTEIITQVTFQAAACHELFSLALRKFLNIYLYICMQTSKPGSCKAAKLHHRPSQRSNWPQHSC